MADDLARLQARFFRLVRAPTGVGPEVPALARDDPQGAPLLGWIRAADEAGAVRRLDVYAEMYFYRLLDVLRGDYQKLARALGDAVMHNLATDYLLAHPSDHPSLRQLGRHLPAFLRTHPLGLARPLLADLAELEWAHVEAFDVADEPALAREVVAALPVDAWPAHRFHAVASLRLLRLDWPADQAWAALDAGGTLPELDARPTDLAVWRAGWRAVHRVVPAGERAALAALLEGAPFAAICETVARESSEPDAAPRVVKLLLRWIDDGLLLGP